MYFNQLTFDGCSHLAAFTLLNVISVPFKSVCVNKNKNQKCLCAQEQFKLVYNYVVHVYYVKFTILRPTCIGIGSLRIKSIDLLSYSRSDKITPVSCSAIDHNLNFQLV